MSQQNLQPTPGLSSTNDISCQISKYLCEAEDHSLSTSHLSDPFCFRCRSREHLWQTVSSSGHCICSSESSRFVAH